MVCLLFINASFNACSNLLSITWPDLLPLSKLVKS
eukprot:UN21120